MSPATATKPVRLCRYCGDPMPPQMGRSRPRVAHVGKCSRKDQNRRRLNWRIERFRSAHRVDRSDECAWAASRYTVGEYDPEAYSTSRGAFDDVHGKALIEAMNAWELAEQIRKTLARAERKAREPRLARQQAERDRVCAKAADTFGALAEAERKARLRAAVATRRTRYGGSLD